MCKQVQVFERKAVLREPLRVWKVQFSKKLQPTSGPVGSFYWSIKQEQKIPGEKRFRCNCQKNFNCTRIFSKGRPNRYATSSLNLAFWRTQFHAAIPCNQKFRFQTDFAASHTRFRTKFTSKTERIKFLAVSLTKNLIKKGSGGSGLVGGSTRWAFGARTSSLKRIKHDVICTLGLSFRSQL